MPRSEQKSPVTIIAIVVSLVIGGLIAYTVFPQRSENVETGQSDLLEIVSDEQSGSEPESGPNNSSPQETEDPASEDQELLEEEPIIVADAVTPIPTPSPTSTPEPSPSPSPTPEPTPSRTPEPQKLRVTGLVDSFEGDPMANARLYICPLIDANIKYSTMKAFQEEDGVVFATTNSGGYYEVDVPKSNNWLIGLMIGDAPQPFVRQIDPEGETEQVIDFQFPRPVKITGSLTDQGYAQIQGVDLEVKWTPDSLLEKKATSLVETVKTNSKGLFEAYLHEPVAVEITLKPEDVPSAYMTDYKTVTLSREELEETRTHRVDFQLMKAANLNGMVYSMKDGAKIPSSSAVITAKPTSPERDPSQTTLQTKTDEEGRFSFNQMWPEPYDLTVDKIGNNRTYLYGVNPIQQSNLEIKLDGLSSLRVHLSGAESEKVNVALLTSQQVASKTVAISQSEKIAIDFSQLKPGDYLVVASETGKGSNRYAEVPVTLDRGVLETTVEVELEDLYTQSGKLTATSNQDYTEYRIKTTKLQEKVGVFEPARFYNKSPRRVPSANITTSGEFSIQDLITGGQYLILAEDRETGEETGSAYITAGETPYLELALRGTGRVAGKVTNSLGEACEGKVIELTTSLGVLDGVSGTIQTRETIVNYDGTFVFDHVPVGSCRLMFKNEEASLRLLTVVKNEETFLNLECRTIVNISFLLDDTEDQPFSTSEQFLVMAQPGTVVAEPVLEISFDDLKVELEPGEYTITRTQTMESRSFVVSPRMDGEIEISFE